MVAGGIALALDARASSGWLGLVLLLATPLCWQLAHVVSIRGLPGVSAHTFTTARYVFGGLLLVPAWVARGGLTSLPPADVLVGLVPVLAIQGVVLTFVGTIFWYETIASTLR